MKEKLIIAGGNEKLRTPPFVYVSESIENKILEQFPESKEYKKFYVITTKPFSEGDLVTIFPIEDKDTRGKVKDFCDENPNSKESYYFSKVIRTDGYVEKFWIEDYYLGKIKDAIIRKNKKIKKQRKPIFYSSPTILIEKDKKPYPEWLKETFFDYFIKFNLYGETKVLDVHKNIVIIKGEKLVNKDFGRPNYGFQHQTTDYRRDVFPYEKTVGLIYFNKKVIDDKMFYLSRTENSKKLITITGSKIFRYFKMTYVHELNDSEVIVSFVQSNDMPKISNGIPMMVYLKLIRKLLSTNDVTKSLNNLSVNLIY